MPFPGLPIHRVLASLLAGLAGAVAAAVALAVVDLYLGGHGLPPLGRPWIAGAAGGVHLSRADVILLASAVVAAVVAWRRSGAGAG